LILRERYVDVCRIGRRGEDAMVCSQLRMSGSRGVEWAVLSEVA
jgi:hypothetical protein